MKPIFTILAIISVALLVGCTSENRDHSRAYVEGKIVGTQVDFNEITVQLKNDGKIIAETVPMGSGEFVLSGPLLSDSFSLVLNRKIKSFSASKSGCTLSSDALHLQIPPGSTFITFNEIILE